MYAGNCAETFGRFINVKEPAGSPHNNLGELLLLARFVAILKAATVKRHQHVACRKYQIGKGQDRTGHSECKLRLNYPPPPSHRSFVEYRLSLIPSQIIGP